MRSFVFAAVLASLPVTAFAQTAPAPAPAALATGYSTANTDLGTLLDDPAAKAVLMKYIPQMISNEQISMARSMTLKSLQQYAADTLPDTTLAKIDTDLAALPATK